MSDTLPDRKVKFFATMKIDSWGSMPENKKKVRMDV